MRVGCPEKVSGEAGVQAIAGRKASREPSGAERNRNENPNDYENREELVSCAAEDLQDALRGAITLEDLEEVAQWLSAYIKAAKRLPE